MKRIESIDFLKGIGIIAIVLCHFGAEYLSKSKLYLITNNFASFVQLFFVITTFLCIRSLQKIDINSRYEQFSWFKGHLIKLIPVYYLSIICYITYELLWSSPPKKIFRMEIFLIL